MRALVIAAALVVSVPISGAETTEAPPVRRHNVAAAVHGALGGGLVIEGERQLARRWSLAGLAGLRSSTSGDFRSLAAAATGELRFWLTGWTVKSPLRASIVGGYFGAGLELARVGLRDEIDDRAIGSTTSVAIAGSFGYRFAPWSRVSITPSLGLAIGRDLAGDLPDRFTIRPRWGVTIGALF